MDIKPISSPILTTAIITNNASSSFRRLGFHTIFDAHLLTFTFDILDHGLLRICFSRELACIFAFGIRWI
jgi:hypothetical protein